MKSFVFANEDDAIRKDQLHRAIYRCKTWAELKTSIHPDEYKFIIYMYYDYDDMKAEIEPTGEIDWSFFDLDSYSGAIYPSFLIYHMKEILPEDILNEYGGEEIITDYDSYHQIKPEKLVPMITALIARGFDVAPAGNLIFDDFYTEV